MSIQFNNLLFQSMRYNQEIRVVNSQPALKRLEVAFAIWVILSKY